MASSLGRIRSLGRLKKSRKGCKDYYQLGRLLKQSPTGNGYPSVALHRRGERQKTYKVCCLVLLTFSGPKPMGMECRHFPDRDVLNSRIDNLSWASHLTNIRDRIVHGTESRGEKNPSAKLTRPLIELIKHLASLDEVKYRNIRIRGRTYPYGSRVRVAHIFKDRSGISITPTMIGYILRGDNWNYD